MRARDRGACVSDVRVSLLMCVPYDALRENTGAPQPVSLSVLIWKEQTTHTQAPPEPVDAYTSFDAFQQHF